jgi:hypothetical protein
VSTTLVTLAMVFASTTPAQADAIGYATWSSQTINGDTIPSGFLEHRIWGDGLTIDLQYASIQPAGYLCDWRIDFRFHDVNNVVYKRILGQEQGSCDLAARQNALSNIKVKSGRACARLHVHGKLIAEQCHGIYP